MVQMPTFSPLTAAILAVLVVAFVIALVAYGRDRARFSGYQDLTAGALALARTLAGEVRRDDQDLVVSGAWQGAAAEVRFSHAENTPGMHIVLDAPANFRFSAMPARSGSVHGRVRLFADDESLNALFAFRADDPVQAKMFMGSPRVTPALQRLGRTPASFLVISAGQMESGEMNPPAAESPTHALDHLQTMAELIAVMREMPGAQAVRLKPVGRPRRWAMRGAIVIGILVAAAAVLIEFRPGANLAAQSPVAAATQNGIAAADAPHIPAISGWEVAKPSDFDPAGITWLQNQGRSPEARLEGNFCPGQDGVAYLLVSRNQQPPGALPSAGIAAATGNRLVVICAGESVYDVKYSHIGLVARIPRESMTSISWLAAPPEAADGDGLLVSRAPDDPASGWILFFRGRRLISGVPLNYEMLKVE